MSTRQKRMADEYYMRMAMSLALRGTAAVKTNPRVGCVLVRDGEILGTGYHARYGGAHAEVEAIRNAKTFVEGSTAYVNLEPCSHSGKTPPCADLLIEKGIKRVVVAHQDPNPLVLGRGIERLQNAGIEVTTPVLERDARWLNRGFINTICLKRPWVTLKAGLSLDGNLALQNGSSKWITSALSRQKAHLLRAENDAILVGIGTVLQDDPALTVRDTAGVSPLRVVLDRDARTPITAKVIHSIGRTIIVVGANANKRRVESLKQLGVLVWAPEGKADFTLQELLFKLVEEGVSYLLVEGGASVHSSFIQNKLVDALSLFVAPKLLGKGLSFLDAFHIFEMESGVPLKDITVSRLGDDLWYEGVPNCLQDS